jgi:hypothetical protein
MKKISIASSVIVFALAGAAGASAKASPLGGLCRGGIVIPCNPVPPVIGGNAGCTAKVGVPCRPLPPVTPAKRKHR